MIELGKFSLITTNLNHIYGVLENQCMTAALCVKFQHEIFAIRSKNNRQKQLFWHLNMADFKAYLRMA